MKREQIANQETKMNEYSYTYFQKIVRFKLKNKKKNMQLIQESLQEFVENQIAIKHFELRNGIFIIQFLPLSDAEIEDLNFDRTKLIHPIANYNVYIFILAAFYREAASFYIPETLLYFSCCFTHFYYFCRFFIK